MFAPARRGWDGKEKDTLKNIRETKEFSVNLVSESFVEEMVVCGTDFKPEIDEFELANLTSIPSIKIKPQVVKESKIKFECKLNQIVQIGSNKAGSGFIVIGEIVLFHIQAFLGRFRMFVFWYCRHFRNYRSHLETMVW